MRPRTRVALIVACAAVAAAAVTVGVTLLTRSEPPAAAVRPRPGVPPLELDLGVRTDAQARALRRAAGLLAQGRREQAARVFTRYPSSLQAQFGLAFAEWPERSPARELQLAGDNPRSAFAQLHLGLALYWAGRPGDAQEAWRRAERVERDSASAVRAGDLIHPQFAPGLPPFVPTFAPAAALERLPPTRRLRAYAAAAAEGGAREKILFGVVLQRLGRPLSARRQFEAAARLAPADPEALTAAAVARFDKDRPAAAFSRLGPLARRFPRAATVHFHLGLMLLWIGQVPEARRQLRLTRVVDPDSTLSEQAKRFLERLRSVRTG